MAALATEALPVMTSLTKLDLSGALLLVVPQPAAQLHHRRVFLDADNKGGSEGTTALAGALPKLTKLRVLRLDRKSVV